MAETKAQVYGLKKVHKDSLDPDNIITGPCLIWAINYVGFGGDQVFDSLSDGTGDKIASFGTDGATIPADKHYVYPKGLPCKVGVSMSSSATITYTPLPPGATVTDHVDYTPSEGVAASADQAAAMYGVKRVQGGAGNIIAGRALLWAIQYTATNSTDIVWDSLTDGPPPGDTGNTNRICTFLGDLTTTGINEKMYHWPVGQPIDHGISATQQVRIVYTPLPDLT